MLSRSNPKTVAIRGNGNMATRASVSPDMTAALKVSVKMFKSGKKPKATLAILGVGVECFIDKEGEYILPASAAECADLLYKARERRLEIQRECDRVEALEKKIKNWFVETLPKSQTGVSGVIAHVKIETSPVPQVEDWDKLYAHVKKTGSWELLQRRLNEGSVKERWENKKQVPGVGVFNVKKVSCTKI